MSHAITKKKKPAPTSPAPLTVSYRAIADLKPNPHNPRIHSKKQIFQIARSIQEFGFTAPVLVPLLYFMANNRGLKPASTVSNISPAVAA